jgi:hypothetical protein
MLGWFQGSELFNPASQQQQQQQQKRLWKIEQLYSPIPREHSHVLIKFF